MRPQEQAYEAIRKALFHIRDREGLFNPYADRDPALDRPDAVATRRENVRAYFAACSPSPDLFLLAEAPGPWGCRFTGIPITAESQLLDPDFPLSGQQTSLGTSPHKEYSAGIFWRLLSDVFPRFVVWNACPLHPYRAGLPLTIRAPRQSELAEFTPLTLRLIDIFKPQRVVAIGRKAEGSLLGAGLRARYVRHPSQGGASAFRDGILEALATLESDDG